MPAFARVHRGIAAWIERLSTQHCQAELRRLRAYANALAIDRMRWRERAIEAERKALR